MKNITIRVFLRTGVDRDGKLSDQKTAEDFLNFY
jgi:hypothetical protein